MTEIPDTWTGGHDPLNPPQDVEVTDYPPAPPTLPEPTPLPVDDDQGDDSELVDEDRSEDGTEDAAEPDNGHDDDTGDA